MSDNLELWNAVADVDPKHTKPITGKDYKGTSPNPTYMIKLATEKFGRVGHGFGWSVLDDGFQTLGDTTLHFCRIEFWWKGEDGEKHSFENYGQTKAAYKTQSGYVKVDEDAPKKSMTDAITKSLSHLGFAGNIFLGLWDDSKYVDEVREEFAKKDDPAEIERQRAQAEEDRLGMEKFTADLISRIQTKTDPLDVAALIQKCQGSIGQIKTAHPEMFKKIENAAKAAGAPMREVA